MTLGRPDAGAPKAVKVLVSVVVTTAAMTLLATAGQAWDEMTERPGMFGGFLAATVALQLMAVRIRDRGAISVSGIAFLATGFTFGPGAAIVTALVAAAVHALRSRPPVHRALFNAGAFSLAAAAASGCYHLLESGDRLTIGGFAIAFLSGAVFAILNVGLLTVAMGISERRAFFAVWAERLRWLTPYYLGFGILALASILAYEDLGPVALLAFAVPPALVVFRAAIPRRLGSAT